MAIYGNLKCNNIDISVLESSLDNEINNFNRIMESINVLNESNIVLESVSLKGILAKFKELLSKLEAYIKQLWKKIKIKIKEILNNKKSEAKNIENTNKDASENKDDNIKQKEVQVIDYKYYNFNAEFFKLPYTISAYGRILHFDIFDDQVKYYDDLSNYENLKIKLEELDENKNIVESSKKDFFEKYDQMLKIETENKSDNKINIEKYYSKLSDELNDAIHNIEIGIDEYTKKCIASYNELAKIIGKMTNEGTSFGYEIAKYCSFIADDIKSLEKINNLTANYCFICTKIKAEIDNYF